MSLALSPQQTCEIFITAVKAWEYKTIRSFFRTMDPSSHSMLFAISDEHGNSVLHMIGMHAPLDSITETNQRQCKLTISCFLPELSVLLKKRNNAGQIPLEYLSNISSETQHDESNTAYIAYIELLKVIATGPVVTSDNDDQTPDPSELSQIFSRDD